MSESEDMEKARAKIERLELQVDKASARCDMAYTELRMKRAKLKLAKLQFMELYPEDKNDYDVLIGWD